jgi:hypothetical protein
LNCFGRYGLLNDDFVCDASAYVMSFALGAFYCWMAVLAYDLSSTVSGAQNHKNYYSAFGYGIPTIYGIYIFVFDILGHQGHSLLLLDTCWWAFVEQGIVYNIPTIMVSVLLASVCFVVSLVKFDRKKLSDEVFGK